MNELEQVGGKALDLLAQLASKIGVTVQELYPCIEKQVQLEGVIGLWVTGILIVLAILFIILAILLKDETGVPFAIIGAVTLIASIIIGATEMSGSITKIKNPKYHAAQRIIDMARKLK